MWEGNHHRLSPGLSCVPFPQRLVDEALVDLRLRQW